MCPNRLCLSLLRIIIGWVMVFCLSCFFSFLFYCSRCVFFSPIILGNKTKSKSVAFESLKY